VHFFPPILHLANNVAKLGAMDIISMRGDSIGAKAGGFGRTLIMKRAILLSISVIALAGQAMAAEVDMSTLTCKEVRGMSRAKVAGIAMWMNGYVHGKAGDAKLDGQKAEANAEMIAAYCKKNPTVTLSSAIDAVAKAK
jgi:acid stress chaperone HdeB